MLASGSTKADPSRICESSGSGSAWAGLTQVHVLLDGHRIKTLPSRLDARDLARLTAAGHSPPGRPRCLPHPGT